jgi:hypothetical protein
MNLFEKTPLAWKKITDWHNREEEFVKRTAYSLLACLAWHSKTATNQQFTAMFPVITEGAQDNRKSIQKAISWALRNIGKRNPQLNAEAIALAYKIKATNTKPARWIANDVIRELESEPVQQCLQNQKTNKQAKNNNKEKKGKTLKPNSQSSPRLKLPPRLDSLRRFPPDPPRFLR